MSILKMLHDPTLLYSPCSMFRHLPKFRRSTNERVVSHSNNNNNNSLYFKKEEKKNNKRNVEEDEEDDE